MRGVRYWEGPEVPSFVPLSAGNMELELLDPIAGGYLALYRTWGSLGPNDAFEARLYSCAGQTLATVPLNAMFSRRDQLEVQDIRYADGTLYFNEACQSYSRDAGGRCSALVAADPYSKRVLWRTGSLVSNSVIRVEGQHVIAGYGFTAESDWVRVVRRSDGKVVEKKALPSSHFELETSGNVLDVEVGGSWSSFRMDGFSSATPHLTSLGTHATRSAGSVPAVPATAAAPPAAMWTLPIQLPAANTWTIPALPAGFLPKMSPHR
jgi:hypothetical protein